MYNPYADLRHMHHAAHWFSIPERWAIANRDYGIVASLTANTANHMTELDVTLILDEHRLHLDLIVRPGGMRTALRWVCQELNNGHLWLSTRLSLERKARLLGYSEPELLACEHAYDYQYCLRLVTNILGLVTD